MTASSMLRGPIPTLPTGFKYANYHTVHESLCLQNISQERRRVEEAYITGLRKLARKQPPDESSNLGCAFLSAVTTRVKRSLTFASGSLEDRGT